MGYLKFAASALVLFSMTACSTQQVVSQAVRSPGKVVGKAGAVVGGTAGRIVGGGTGQRIGQSVGQSAAKKAVPTPF